MPGPKHFYLRLPPPPRGRARQRPLRNPGSVQKRFPDCDARIILTGSGAKPVAEAAGTPYIQEVVANSIALKKTYETVGTAIELGGQDAKIIFCDILPPLS